VTAEIIAVTVDALWLSLWLSLPALGAALLAGLLTGALASVTQWGDPSVTVVPRLLAVFGGLALSLTWMGAELHRYTGDLWAKLGTLFS
jgi:type III secretory pathway component EscS